MNEHQPARSFVPSELRSRECRNNSVLILRGTGLNGWHYYPFLRNFTLSELAEFSGVYGVSGGAAVYWVYCLAQMGRIDASNLASRYDSVLRTALNQFGFGRRLIRVVTGKSPYSSSDHHRALSELLSAGIVGETFSSLGLRNFEVVAHDERADKVVTVGLSSYPDLPVGQVIACAGTPGSRRIPFRGVNDGVNGFLIADLDFAPKSIRREFAQLLASKFPTHSLYHINIASNRSEGQQRYVQVCGNRFPRLHQIDDFVRVFLGLPNSNYTNAFRQEYPL